MASALRRFFTGSDPDAKGARDATNVTELGARLRGAYLPAGLGTPAGAFLRLVEEAGAVGLKGG